MVAQAQRAQAADQRAKRSLHEAVLKERAAAEKTAPQPVGRLDWFLTGLEHYRRDQFVESITACEQVLQLQNDDFWAHYVTALAQLRGHASVRARVPGSQFSRRSSGPLGEARSSSRVARNARGRLP